MTADISTHRAFGTIRFRKLGQLFQMHGTRTFVIARSEAMWQSHLKYTMRFVTESSQNRANKVTVIEHI